jgi:cysteine-rich repeat protein
MQPQPHAPLMPGITVMSYGCEIPDMSNNMMLCGPLTHDAFACADSMGSEAEQAIGWIILVPTDCASFHPPTRVWKIDEDQVDLAQVLLHELGHTLGLHHCNRTQAECEAGGNIHGGTETEATGVMHASPPFKYAAFRSWRRDDLAGLQALYGDEADPHEIAWWDDALYPNYPDDALARSLVGMAVSRSAAISGQPGTTTQVLATTAGDGRVLHRLIDAQGQITPGLGDVVVDPSPHGITHAMPAAASGWQGADERVFVAWIADEIPESISAKLRVALRSTDSLDWTIQTHPDEFWVNRVSAGFVPDFEAFMVTTLTGVGSRIALILFDGEGQAIGETLVLDEVQAFDVGAPACTGARCLIPFSRPVFGGPDFGVLEVQVDAMIPAVTIMSQEVLPELDTRGRLDLLDNFDLIGSSGAGRFNLGGYPGLAPDLAAQFNPQQDWPLALGQWTGAGLMRRRMVQARPVVCGNGLVQGDEVCDDGNDLPGDGCHMCEDEAGNESSGELGGGDEVFADDATGDGSLDGFGAEGCECRAGHEAQGNATVFVCLVLLTLRRGSREGRRRALDETMAKPESPTHVALPTLRRADVQDAPQPRRVARQGRRVRRGQGQRSR